MSPGRSVPLVEFLPQVPDPRRQRRNLRHPLPSVSTLAFCAVWAGANSFREMELFCRSREDVSRDSLELRHGYRLTARLPGYFKRWIRTRWWELCAAGCWTCGAGGRVTSQSS